MNPTTRSKAALFASSAIALLGCARPAPTTIAVDPCATALPSRVALLPVSDRTSGPFATLSELATALEPDFGSDTVELLRAYELGGDRSYAYTALESSELGIARDVHLALETPGGWFSSGPLGTSMEDRTGSAFTVLADGYLGTFEDGGDRVDVVLIRIDRGESYSRGCDPPDQLAGEYYRLCALGPTLDCYAEITGRTVPYDREILPSAAEALGECDDVASAPSTPAPLLAPITIGFVDATTLQVESDEGGVERFTLGQLHARARRCPVPVTE